MTTYFIKYSCGVGMRECILVEANSQDEADQLAREYCIDFATEYGYYQDEDYFGDLDQLYKEDSWDDEEEEYSDISELEYYAEEYDPETHDEWL